MKLQIIIGVRDTFANHIFLHTAYRITTIIYTMSFLFIHNGLLPLSRMSPKKLCKNVQWIFKILIHRNLI